MTRLLVLLGILFISFSAIFVRQAAASPITAAFFRTAFAIPFLILLKYLLAGSNPQRTRARWIALGSGLILAVDLSAWHHAIDLIGAGLSTVLGNTQVMFVALAAWIFHRERPSNLALFIIPFILLGVMLISGLGRDEAYGVNPVGGTLFGLSTAILYTSYLLVFRAANRELAHPVGPLLDSTIGAAVTSLVFGTFDPDFSLIPVWPTHGWLLALALVSQVAGWLLISNALPRLAALETSVMLPLQPALTLFWAWLLFAENLSHFQWMGVVLVLSGVGLLSVKGSVEVRTTNKKPFHKTATGDQ